MVREVICSNLKTTSFLFNSVKECLIRGTERIFTIWISLCVTF